MKKIILSLSVCSMMLLLANCSEKQEIPDANFKAYLLENFDTDKNGKISIKEAEAVTEINCSGKGIKNLAGIELFVNLESLDCSNNQLDDVEVQKNKKLKKLDCRGNNAGFKIYFSASSPLKSANFQIPAAGGPPQNTNSMTNPLDVSKCLFDEGTIPIIHFE